ncbi:MAG: PAS domain S-box protein [Rhodospirillales bacterium]|nr:PAS domain S-box protein [Rhodospirillales bacterium]
MGSASLAGTMLWSSFMQTVSSRSQATTFYSRMLESSITRTIESVEISLHSLTDDIQSLDSGDANLPKIQARINEIIRFAPHVRQIVLIKDQEIKIDTNRNGKERLDLRRFTFDQSKTKTFVSKIKIGQQISSRYLPYIGEKVIYDSRRSLIPLALKISSENTPHSYWLIVALNSAYIQNLFAELNIERGDQFGLLKFDGTPLIKHGLKTHQTRTEELKELINDGKDEVLLETKGSLFPASHISIKLSGKYPFAILVSVDHRQTFKIWFIKNQFLIIGLLIATLAIVLSALTLIRDYLKTSSLQEQVRLLSSAVHQFPSSVIITDSNAQIQYVNPAFTEIFGISPQDALGKNPSILNSGLTGAAVYLEMWDNLNKGESWQGEFKNKTAKGKIVPVAATISPILNYLGKPTHLIGILTDTTENNQAEEAVRKLSQAVEQSPVTVVITDEKGDIEYVNPKFEATTGYSFEEVKGKNPRILSSGEKTAEEYKDLWETITSGKEWHGEFHNKHKNGSLYWETASISPIKTPDGSITNYLAVKEDITATKKAADTLRENEALLRGLFDALPDLVWMKNFDGSYMACNPRLEKLFGAKRSEIIGKTDYDFVSQKQADIFRESDKAAIARKGTVISEKELTYALDNHKELIETAKTPVHDSQGKLIGVLGVGRDITKRKMLEDQVRRSQKMEAVGYLTGGIAHDFNNILGIIMGNLELLQRMVSKDEKALKRVEKALGGAERGANITKKLLGFSRKLPQESHLISPNDFIENLEELIAKSLTASIKIETYLSKNLWSVSIDPSDFEDAILNLSLNARDAMPKGGTLTFETANKVLDDDFTQSNPGSKPGDHVMISVTDTGEGMTEHVQENAIEPFFTTKEQGKGTGLGLSMVFGFVNRSNGHLKIYSELGKGTSIQIFLPRVEQKTDQPLKTSQDASAPRGTETVLVVDDEEALLDIAISNLEILGYKTLSATNGKQALQILENNPDIDLLFSDIIMPGEYDGYRLALTAHQTYPSLKILLASGFTHKHDEYLSGENAYMARVASNLLSKPYNLDDMATHVRQTLDHEE